MFREKIKVLDCTIRDGGLINNHDFGHKFVRSVYKALSEAGVDYMEIGYKNSKKLFPEKDFGTWKFCDDDDIKKVVDGIESQTKVSVMVDVGRVLSRHTALNSYPIPEEITVHRRHTRTI